MSVLLRSGKVGRDLFGKGRSLLTTIKECFLSNE
jgi:hypothetical protein